MKKITLFFIFFLSTQLVFSQYEGLNTFKDSRIINTHSVETLPKKIMDVRIGHRFGDFAGDAGGWAIFYGLENASDVMIGFEYGITDELMIGINRSKSAGPLTRLINTQLKYRFLSQDDDTPISVAFFGNASVSTLPASDVPNTITSFDKFGHRMVYVAQFLIARKLSDAISLQVTPSFVHRNVVEFNDKNDLFSIGAAGRIQISKIHALLFDVALPFSELRTAENGYYIPFGIAWEFDTGGHRFQVNLTNSKGISPADYLPNTTSNWGDGQFRLGFTISRWFKM